MERKSFGTVWFSNSAQTGNAIRGDKMKAEEDYFFDVMGYLIVRDILTPKEVEALNQAMDRGRRSDGMLGWPSPIREPFRDLLVHPNGGISQPDRRRRIPIGQRSGTASGRFGRRGACGGK